MLKNTMIVGPRMKVHDSPREGDLPMKHNDLSDHFIFSFQNTEGGDKGGGVQ